MTTYSASEVEFFARRIHLCLSDIPPDPLTATSIHHVEFTQKPMTKPHSKEHKRKMQELLGSSGPYDELSQGRAGDWMPEHYLIEMVVRRAIYDTYSKRRHIARDANKWL